VFYFLYIADLNKTEENFNTTVKIVTKN